MNQEEQMILNYPLFDGKKVIENASVSIRNGRIDKVAETDNVKSNFFLMPGLMDAHTHMSAADQIPQMLKNGIVATCDVSASASLITNAEPFKIISSAGMTMGTLSGKAYVKNAIEAGAKYIKVLLMEPNFMLKSVLKDICNTAHESNRKVAVHAVSVKAVRMAVDCGADILLHVPLKEALPEGLAQKIADRKIAVAPTLVMMETFANSGRNGYKPADYQNAENAVRLLKKNGVTILAATDANIGNFAPAVAYGTSLHREMKLLVQAGMTPVEVLESATSNVAEVFGLTNAGIIAPGQPATTVLVKGRPDQEITDSTKIVQIWVNGKPILEKGK